MSFFRMALVIATLTSLAGCGQSGALYLPGNPSDVQETPQTEPAPAERGDAEDDEDDAAP